MFRAEHYYTSSSCTTTSERLLACTGEPTCSCVQGKLNQKRRKNVDVSLLKNYEAIINNNDFTKTPDDSAKPGCRLAQWVGIIMFSHMYGPWPRSECVHSHLDVRQRFSISHWMRKRGIHDEAGRTGPKYKNVIWKSAGYKRGIWKSINRYIQVP